MRIIIDLDGTICELRKHGQDYSQVKPNPLAIQKIKALKKQGHYLIIQTSRHMKTCGGDQGQVLAKVGAITLDWLKKHKVPYDEIYLGKPNGDVYIDDLSFKMTGWDQVEPKDFSSETVNILIPMAGAGSRFVKAGYKEPKPLIKVRGKLMIEWALKSFDFLKNHPKKNLIFVIQKESEKQYGLSAALKKIFNPKIKIVQIDGLTSGQAETCLKAKKHINNYNRLFIYNCDTYSTSKIWDLIEKEDPDGILPCFKASDPRYSFARLDQYGYVDKTAEKKAISNLATTGMYYFKRGLDFVWAAQKQIEKEKTENSEFYVAPCYNELISIGQKIKTVPTDLNWVLGTPEELEYFKNNFK